ncbi:MAG TPA: hypothetical protein VFZ65_15455 [Planctomycetota bacterium]|nr:hypothetical protein [Planctomycetota bacterium]
MATAVVFAFAVADGLSPVVGAAPYDVLARQLPRMLVSRLNGGGDRGVRFFPFLGPVDGQRSFLRLHEFFAPEVLAQLHKQGEVQLLCDGMFRSGVLQWRILDGTALRVLSSGELAFDARQPIDGLLRIEFEIMGVLGWTGRPRPPCPLEGEALGWFLVLKDALLRVEANLGEAPPDPLRPARRCVELCAENEDVQQVLLDLAGLWLRRDEQRVEVGHLLVAFAAREVGGVAVLERLAALLLVAGEQDRAADVAARAARLAPEKQELVERTAALLFRLGRDREVREIVELARQRGAASSSALAQLAAVCDRNDDPETRDALIAELAAMPDLPVPVARLVVSFLLDDERAQLARSILQRALAKEPGQAMLHFELGRAHLMLDDGPAAAAALRRGMSLGLAPALATQAQRLVRLSAEPGLWARVERIDRLIAAAGFAQAFRELSALLRGRRRVADLWFLFGLVRHKLQQPRRAERALRRALRYDADLGEAHNRLGILLVAKGQVKAGYTHLERAHRLAPGDPSTLLHLAQACALLGRSAEAQRHLEAAGQAGAEPDLVAAVRRQVLTSRA